MLVRALMESKPKNLIITDPDTSVDKAMEMLIENGIACLPVVDSEQKLIGIVSDKDIFKKVYETKGDYHNLSVGEMMTTELIVGLPEDDISYIAGVMHKNWIRHIPIVDGDTIIGLVSQTDIIKMQAENIKAENRYLKLYTNSLGSRDKSSDF